MSDNLDDILSDCLDRLARGEKVAECVERYPEHRDELAPLLEVASAMISAASSVTYSAEAKTRGLHRLTSAMARRQQSRARRIVWLPWRPRVPRPLAVGVVLAVLTTGMAFATTAASSDSVPGDPLYWVKNAKESISLVVPQSDADRAMMHVHLAKVRGQEMRKLMVMNRLDEAERTALRLRRHLNASAGFAGIITSINPIEMPRRPTVLVNHEKAFLNLARQLERDRSLFRSRLLELVPKMPSNQRQRADLLRLRSEMVYRMLAAAMEDGGAPSWGLWRVVPPFSRSR